MTGYPHSTCDVSHEGWICIDAEKPGAIAGNLGWRVDRSANVLQKHSGHASTARNVLSILTAREGLLVCYRAEEFSYDWRMSRMFYNIVAEQQSPSQHPGLTQSSSGTMLRAIM